MENNQFANRFKENRKKNDWSQEQIADMLCVTAQAVSKWETGVSYPDLSLLPIIANLFGVSADYLLGINLSEKEEVIDKTIEECDLLTKEQRYSDAVTILRDALIKYPSEPRLMYKLAWNLTGTIREHRENLYEAIKLYEKILQLTEDQELKNKTLRDLMLRYSTADDEDTARKIAYSLVPFEFCKEYNLGRSNLLYGRELAEYLMKNIKMYGVAMKECLEYFTYTTILTEEQMKPLSVEAGKEKIAELDKILDFDFYE